MRVAVLHDFLSTIGGGEKVALTLARGIPADLYTTDVDEDVVRKAGFGGVEARSLGDLPRMAPLKQIRASLRFCRARLPDYDAYVMSGNWAHYAAARHGPSLLYCHTPVRAFYDLRDWTIQHLEGPHRQLAARLWIRFHRWWDQRSVARIDRIVANSENVRKRVRKYYGRSAAVVHPPVPTAKFQFKEVGDFWLSVNRLYPEKRLDLQMEIMRRLPLERLVVVGTGAPGDHSKGYRARLKPPPNVEFAGRVTEERLLELYGRCRGLITTAVDEDFGLTPVEAMASGKVVLATDEGGYRESVVHRDTGWLLPPTADAFVAKIQSLDIPTLEGMRWACQERAKVFDESAFIARMCEHIDEVVAPEVEAEPWPA